MPADNLTRPDMSPDDIHTTEVRIPGYLRGGDIPDDIAPFPDRGPGRHAAGGPGPGQGAPGSGQGASGSGSGAPGPGGSGPGGSGSGFPGPGGGFGQGGGYGAAGSRGAQVGGGTSGTSGTSGTGGTGSTGGGEYPPAPGGAEATPADQKRLRFLVIASFFILCVALVGGLLLGSVYSGGSGKKKPGPTKSSTAANPDFATVKISSGRLAVSVPRTWLLGTDQTWVPTKQGVGFTDASTEPVLRAAPDIAGFRSAEGKVPGVFIGLTLPSQTVPPTGGLDHATCQKSAPANYTNPSGTLSGQIIRFTSCTTGVPMISEVGLKDKSGKLALWVRLKQTDPAKDLTVPILDSIQAS
jgi:hypothetical protein